MAVPTLEQHRQLEDRLRLALQRLGTLEDRSAQSLEAALSHQRDAKGQRQPHSPQTGLGTPTHNAPIGTEYYDTTNDLKYINNDGLNGWTVQTSGLPAAAHNVLSATHSDSLVASVVDGDTLIGNVTPRWSRLAISIPAANVRNVLGIDNGELRPSWKTALDATAPTTIAEGAAAAAGTSLIFSHRDHTHGAPTTWAATAHNLLSATHGDAVGAVAAASGALVYANTSNLWDTSIQTTHKLTYVAGILTVALDGNAGGIVNGYGLGATPLLRVGSAQGTLASPTATLDTDSLGRVQWAGYFSGFKVQAYIEGLATEDFGATRGAKLNFYTTATGGSTTPVLAMTLEANGDLTLAQNITMAASKTVDGVDVGAHTHGGAGQGGTVDHGSAGGLTDDDHTQYQKETEKDAAGGYAGSFRSGHLGDNINISFK